MRERLTLLGSCKCLGPVNSPVLCASVQYERPVCAADTLRSSCPSQHYSFLPQSATALGSPSSLQSRRCADKSSGQLLMSGPEASRAAPSLLPVQLGVLVPFSTLLVPSALGPFKCFLDMELLSLSALLTPRRADSRGTTSSLQRWTVLDRRHPIPPDELPPPLSLGRTDRSGPGGLRQLLSTCWCGTRWSCLLPTFNGTLMCWPSLAYLVRTIRSSSCCTLILRDQRLFVEPLVRISSIAAEIRLFNTQACQGMRLENDPGGLHVPHPFDLSSPRGTERP